MQQVLDDVVARGWAEESEGALRLTATGEAEHAASSPLVDAVRQRVAAALPQDQYPTLVRLLEQLVAGLEPPGS